MSELCWLSDDQMARLEPFCEKSHGKPQVVDRHTLNGISSSTTMAYAVRIRLGKDPLSPLEAMGSNRRTPCVRVSL